MRLKKKEGDIRNALLLLNKKLNKTNKKLENLNINFKKIQNKFSSNSQQLKEAQKKVDELKKMLAKGLRVLYKRKENKSNTYWLYVLLGEESFVDIEKDYYYLKTLLNYNQLIYEKALEVEADILKLQGKLKKDKDKIKQIHNKYKKEEKGLKKSKTNKDKLLEKQKRKRLIYEQELKELKESEQQLQNVVNLLLRKKRSMKKVAKKEEKDYLELIRRKGFMSWPVKGKVITKFGKQKHPKLNTYHISNGIEIFTTRGTEVKAASNGEVAYIGQFKRYGNMVILDHQDGVFTVYAYLNYIKVKEGEVLEKGKAIASTGISSLNKKGALYFEIRIDGFPMDPLLWLK